MEYILLVVVVLFILVIAWLDREARQERAELVRQYARERSELLTRITHPDVALVPVQESRELLPDVDPEPDEFGMVGQVFPGSENEAG